MICGEWLEIGVTVITLRMLGKGAVREAWGYEGGVGV